VPLVEVAVRVPAVVAVSVVVPEVEVVNSEAVGLVLV
jgi:hypothetical protein